MQSFFVSFLIFVSGVSFEIYACSILTDFVFLMEMAQNVLVLDSTNFLFTDFLFDSVFASVLETGKTNGITFLCSRQH